MNAVEFIKVRTGQEFYQSPSAEEADIKTEPQKANVKAGYVNCIGKSDSIRSYIEDSRIVWVR
jgi:hypothetical protein